MSRFAMCALLLTLAGSVGAAAAPVPKDAGKGNPTPNLKDVFAVVEKAVKAEKWPAEADEKKLKDTARVVFERMLKAAEQKERKLPVDFEKLTKADVVKNYKAPGFNHVFRVFVIAENAEISMAEDSVIYVSGNAKISSAVNCVIIGKNVRCMMVGNCVIIADKFISASCVDKQEAEGSSVLVAGQWIRADLDAQVNLPRHASDRAGRAGRCTIRANGPQPAIRTDHANDVIFLNDSSDTRVDNRPHQCIYLPQKTPIAK